MKTCRWVFQSDHEEKGIATECDTWFWDKDISPMLEYSEFKYCPKCGKKIELETTKCEE